MEQIKCKRFSGENFDDRILLIKSCSDGWGYFSLFVSHSHLWKEKKEFLKAIKLYSSKSASNDQNHFNQLLSWFNNHGSDQLTIHPPYECQSEVLIDEWDHKTILWQEENKYFVYSWYAQT